MDRCTTPLKPQYTRCAKLPKLETVMPSSHRQHWQDKTVLTRQDCVVLSCRHPQCELNWQQVKTVGDWKCQNSFVQSQNVVWIESCLVLTQFPIRNVVTYCDVIFGRLVHKCIHITGRHRTKLFSLQYIEDYWKLSATVATQFTPLMPTRWDSLVLSAMWTRN